MPTWYIQTSSCNISAQQRPRVGLAKFKERGSALLLFLLAMDVLDGHVNIVKQL